MSREDRVPSEIREFSGLEQLESAVGTHLGFSGWHVITQERIDRFAEATGDAQWIHTDPVSAATGPFGSTIAHGYLSLSLIPMMMGEIYRVDGISMGVNYGSNRVRFPAVVPVDSRLRAGAELVAIEWRPGGMQVTVLVTVEREGGDKPVCIAELLALLVP